MIFVEDPFGRIRIIKKLYIEIDRIEILQYKSLH